MNSQLHAKEGIDTVADLRVGDELEIEGRTKPFVVTKRSARTIETYDGERIVQHAAEIEGDWQGAKTYVLADVVNALTGEVPGEQKFLGDVPRGVPETFDVRRVGGDEQ